jgi:hypothetical protein
MFPKHIDKVSETFRPWCVDLFAITLPNPPTRIQENIRKVVKVFSQLPKEKFAQLQAPAQIEVVRTTVKSPIIKAVKVNLGIVYEYGNFAIIMPDTFYHITKIEAKFLVEVIALSEKWNVRSFVVN